MSDESLLVGSFHGREIEPAHSGLAGDEEFEDIMDIGTGVAPEDLGDLGEVGGDVAF